MSCLFVYLWFYSTKFKIKIRIKQLFFQVSNLGRIKNTIYWKVENFPLVLRFIFVDWKKPRRVLRYFKWYSLSKVLSISELEIFVPDKMCWTAGIQTLLFISVIQISYYFNVHHLLEKLYIKENCNKFLII